MTTLNKVVLTVSTLAFSLVATRVLAGDDARGNSLTLNPVGLLVHHGGAQYELDAPGPGSFLVSAHLWKDGNVNTAGKLLGFGAGAGYRRYFFGRNDFAGPFAQVNAQLLRMRHRLDDRRFGAPRIVEDDAVVAAVGPQFGYKWMLVNGLTAEVAGGVQWGIGDVGPYEFSALHAQLAGSLGYSW